MNLKNCWIGIGRIANDLEIKVTSSGKKVLNISLAIDDGTKDYPHTTFLQLEAWEKMAEIIERYFNKGDEIITSGRLVVRKTEDRGEKRNRTSIVLESFEWGRKKKEKTEEPKQETETYYANDDDFPF